MKRIAGFAALACLLAGCTTIKGNISSYEPIAVVSVFSNKIINWYGEEAVENSKGIEDSIRKALVPNRTAGKVDYSEADDLIVEAADILMDILNNSGIAKIAEPAEVLESEAYLNAETDKRKESSGYIKAPSYKFINVSDKVFPAAIAAEKGIKSTMHVQFDFTKDIANGVGKNGSMKARITMQVIILDAEGKKILNESNDYSSTDRIPVVTGAYDNDALMDLFRSVLYEACADLVYRMNN